MPTRRSCCSFRLTISDPDIVHQDPASTTYIGGQTSSEGAVWRDPRTCAP
jgi:hypothetical protein